LDRSGQLAHRVLATQVFIALCSAALALETSQIAGIAAESIGFYAFLFFATLTSYRLHSHMSYALAGTRYKHETGSRVITLAAAAASGLLTVHLNGTALFITGVAAALAWLYSVPMWAGAKRLRECGVAKILVLVGVWTLMTSVLPLISKADAPTIAILAFRRFLFVFALCMAFDVRDIRCDAHGGIRTLAVRMGTERSYRLIRLTLAAFAMLSLFIPVGRPAEISPGIAAALVSSALLTWLTIEATRGRRSNLLFLGGVDGMMLVQSVLVCSATMWLHP
jgi:4-hydroxybenzoate polyprenyltransferase